MFHSYQHKTLLIGCSLLAISSLLSGQWIIENVFNFETTLSVVINFLGGIYFLYLLLKTKSYKHDSHRETNQSIWFE